MFSLDFKTFSFWKKCKKFEIDLNTIKKKAFHKTSNEYSPNEDQDFICARCFNVWLKDFIQTTR